MPLMFLIWFFVIFMVLIIGIWIWEGWRLERELIAIRKLLERFEIIEVEQAEQKEGDK
jgi:hypothetical protein